MLMLTLDDAVKVLVRCGYVDPEMEECVRNELEQKCWIPEKRYRHDPIRTIYECTCDVNPREIASHIEIDNLRNWCSAYSTTVIMALKEIETGDED